MRNLTHPEMIRQIETEGIFCVIPAFLRFWGFTAAAGQKSLKPGYEPSESVLNPEAHTKGGTLSTP